MTAYPKTHADLELELAEQMQALRDSAAAYDEGKRWEAKRLATTAFILLNDSGRKTQSLLTQLNLKRDTKFISTVKPDEVNSPLPLAMITIDFVNGVSTYAPFLDAESTHRTEMKFSKWYSQPVFKSESGKDLSRMNLIYILRNQLGGGHVDKELKDEAVHQLTKGVHTVAGDGPWTDEAGNEFDEVPFAKPFKSGPVANGHWATMRQIAWEIELSMRARGY